MLHCWELKPKCRPTFSEVVESLSKSLETMADYTDIRAFGKELTTNQIGKAEKGDHLALTTTALSELPIQDIDPPQDMTVEIISEETKV